MPSPFDNMDTSLADESALQRLIASPDPIDQTDWLTAAGVKRGVGKYEGVEDKTWIDSLAHEFGIDTKNVQANRALADRQAPWKRLLDEVNQGKAKGWAALQHINTIRGADPTQEDITRTNPELATRLNIPSPTAGAIRGPGPELPTTGLENQTFTKAPGQGPLTPAMSDIYHASLGEIAKGPEHAEQRTFREEQARLHNENRMQMAQDQRDFLQKQSELYKLTADQQEELRKLEIEIRKMQKDALASDRTNRERELRFNRDRRSALGALGLTSMFTIDEKGNVAGFNPSAYNTREADLKKWVAYADRQAEYFKSKNEPEYAERWRHEAESYRAFTQGGPQSAPPPPPASSNDSPPPGMSFEEFKAWNRRHQQKP